jgi:acylphosphatase
MKRIPVYRCIVYGKVQGVFYRKSVSKNMIKNSFKGYVKNLKDGTVEVVAQVSDDEFDAFRQILHEGSFKSHVEDIKYEVIDELEFNYDRFEIRYED